MLCENTPFWSKILWTFSPLPQHPSRDCSQEETCGSRFMRILIFTSKTSWHSFLVAKSLELLFVIFFERFCRNFRSEENALEKFGGTTDRSYILRSARSAKQKDSFDYADTVQLLGWNSYFPCCISLQFVSFRKKWFFPGVMDFFLDELCEWALSGLDDGIKDDSDPTSIHGAYLSFLQLRHLRIRDLQRTVSSKKWRYQLFFTKYEITVWGLYKSCHLFCSVSVFWTISALLKEPSQ